MDKAWIHPAARRNLGAGGITAMVLSLIKSEPGPKEQKHYLIMAWNPDNTPKDKREITAEHARNLWERAGIKTYTESELAKQKEGDEEWIQDQK